MWFIIASNSDNVNTRLTLLPDSQTNSETIIISTVYMPCVLDSIANVS